MHQLEIKYFYPLTEQIDLDLDYKPCNEFEEAKRKKWLTDSITSSGQYLIAGNGITDTTWATTASLQFKPDPKAVGHWAIGKDIQVWREQRPNWLHRKMTKVFFGWEWKDK